MSRPPRIAIPIPTSVDQDYNRRCYPLYLDAVRLAGGEPVTVPLDGSAASVVATCAGLLLPGSLADVSPARYGQDRDPACADPDPARESADQALLEWAERHAMPVLGICYGLQSINVWRGGSLIQDLAILPVNHPAGPSIAVAHTVVVAPGSAFGRKLDPKEAPETGGALRLPVNSSHHQAVAAVGEGLQISATCPGDGVIEAVEGKQTSAGGAFLLAVQWHPERSYDISAASRMLFQRLVQAAQA